MNTERQNVEPSTRTLDESAREFGSRRGWKTSAKRLKPFGISALSGIPVDPMLSWWEARLEDEFPHHFTDHAWFYRDHAGHPVAVAAHLYDGSPKMRSEAEAWADAHGLRVSWPTDFPSWWYPGWTTLVVYERKAT